MAQIEYFALITLKSVNRFRGQTYVTTTGRISIRESADAEDIYEEVVKYAKENTEPEDWNDAYSVVAYHVEPNTAYDRERVRQLAARTAAGTA